MDIEKTLVCKCGKNNWRKKGVVLSRQGKRQRYQCRDCARVIVGEYVEQFEPSSVKVKETKKA